MQLRISIIAALAPNRSIGHSDALPWRMPRDMQFFRRMTTGHVVLMGRNTFESLGCKPLPRRINVILTRAREYNLPSVLVARNIDDAIDIAIRHTRRERLFVIGGGSVYQQTYTLADELFLTQIERRDPLQPALFEDEFYGDTFFPNITASNWELCHVSRRYRALDALRPRPDPERVNYYFRFFKYARRSCGCTQAERRRVQVALTAYGPIELPIGQRRIERRSESSTGEP